MFYISVMRYGVNLENSLLSEIDKLCLWLQNPPSAVIEAFKLINAPIDIKFGPDIEFALLESGVNILEIPYVNRHGVRKKI